MKVDITKDNKYFVISSDYIFELNVIRNAFTREIPNAWMLKKVTSIVNTERCFMNNYNMIPVGLWLEIIKIAKKFNIAMEMTPSAQLYLNLFLLDKETFLKYIDDLFEDAKDLNGNLFKPYDYLIEAAYTILKYKKSCAEISTSGGKTLISFIIFKYLIDVCGVQNILYIVPSVDLATQSAEKYEQYESFLSKHNHNWEIGILRAGLKKKEKEKVESCNILFGTFQSLCKRDYTFFNRFNACITDECLTGDTLILMADNTYKKISNVNIGDKVITLNTNTMLKEIHEVEYVYHNLSSNENLYDIEMENNIHIKITGNHKVFTNNGWKRTDTLTINDEIINYDNTGKSKIKHITNLGKTTLDVYNLRIKTDSEYCHNYFANNLCVSNCHHSKANSLLNIFNKLDVDYSIGVTGTFPKDNLYEYLLLQSYIGPLIYKFTANDLINGEKKGTPVYIVFEIMDWASEQEKIDLYKERYNKDKEDITSGAKALKNERLFVNNSYTRVKFIGDKAINTTKNALVLFADIKYGYGKKIYEYIKNNSDKNVYYTDGNTKSEVRDYYKQCMEEDNTGNTIIVASINTFGEGIDIKNLWSIFLVDTAKSDRLVRQICGRGIRLYPGKDKVILFDFVDDLRYTQHPRKYYKDNYLWKHYLERKKIYLELKFPVYEEKIKFSN